MASLSQGRTAAAQFGLFTHKSVPVIFEPPCMYVCMCVCMCVCVCIYIYIYAVTQKYVGGLINYANLYAVFVFVGLMKN